MEHRRKYERKREEKLIREKQERIKKAREEHARAQRVRHESACKYIGQGKCLHVPHNLGRKERVLPHVPVDHLFFTLLFLTYTLKVMNGSLDGPIHTFAS